MRNRSFHVAGLLSALTVLALVAAAAPAGAAITPTQSAPVVAGAMADSLAPGELAGSAFPVIPVGGGIAPAATANSPLAGFPTSGTTFSLVSSGDTRFADDPNSSTSTGFNNGGGDGGHGPEVQDLVTLRLNVNVPPTANCLTLDFRFLSEEFPEFVGGSVNDAFVAELDASNFTIGPNNEVIAPRNFAFDEGGNVISVNTAGFSAANSAGTTYDGATSLLRASTPVAPGGHAVYVSIFDQGDGSYDSTALLDRVRLANVPPASCTAGASADTIAPETTITEGPADGSTIAAGNTVFGFASSEPGSAFQCSLDGGAFADCSSPQPYGGLAPGSHTFSVRAFDAAGNGDPTPATRSFTVGSSGPLPPPVAGVSANLEPVSGTVTAKCKGDSGFREVTDPEQVAIGCTLDVTRGRVRLTSGTDEAGETQSASFFLGVFKIKQELGETEVTLKLNGKLDCGGGNGRAAASKRGRRRGGRGLWGDGDGRFTTRGNRGAGSVRGTRWFVGDNCDGSTEVRVNRGVVSFRDFVADRTVEVKAGGRYSTDPKR